MLHAAHAACSTTSVRTSLASLRGTIFPVPRTTSAQLPLDAPTDLVKLLLLVMVHADDIIYEVVGNIFERSIVYKHYDLDSKVGYIKRRNV